nr:hypothetical protein [uncultured Mediterranean phage uvMED]
MSFQTIRALIETRVNDAYQALATPVPVVFQNVQEEAPGTEYVRLSIDYTSTSEPILNPLESGIEVIRGNIQLAIYTPRSAGMGRLESLSTTGLIVLNSLKSWSLSDPNGIKCQLGPTLGPVNVLSGNDPLALSNVSAAFLAYG